jgi:hypothetical protein
VGCGVEKNGQMTEHAVRDVNGHCRDHSVAGVPAAVEWRLMHLVEPIIETPRTEETTRYAFAGW